MGPWIPLIREWLRADQDAPRKQRHTARRVWERLVEEYDAEVAEPSVRRVVRHIRAELEDRVAEVAIVARHEPGEEAEVAAYERFPS